MCLKTIRCKRCQKRMLFNENKNISKSSWQARGIVRDLQDGTCKRKDEH